MDLKASIAHFKKIQQQAGGLCHSIKEVWNEWAKELMDERGWDEEKQRYKEPATPEWEEKANLEFRASSFKLNSPAYHNDQTEFRVGKTGVNFSGCIFPGSIQIIGGQIDVPHYFTGALFLRDAVFDYLTIDKDFDFSEVQCFGNISFRNSKFKKAALFRELKIKNGSDADFSDIIFEDRADFSQSEFTGFTDFSGCKFEKITSFYNAKFDEDADFSAIYSKQYFDLIEAVFTNTPYFSSYKFDHLPYINGTTIAYQSRKKLINLSKIDQAAIGQEISNLQTLKSMAIAANDHEKEVEFFSSEMRCQAIKLGGNYTHIPYINNYVSLHNLPKRLPYIGYDLLSGYGRSILRPICWWFGLIFILALVYYSKVSTCLKSLYLSFLHSIPILGLWSSENHKKIVELYFGKEAYGWDVIFIIQNFTSAIIIFLIFQAIRNKFKIK